MLSRRVLTLNRKAKTNTAIAMSALWMNRLAVVTTGAAAMNTVMMCTVAMCVAVTRSVANLVVLEPVSMRALRQPL